MPRRRAHKADQRTERLVDGAAAVRKTYKVVSVSLYSDQAEIVDRAAEELALAGFGKANRSLIVQTAIQRLKEDLEGKDRNDVVAYFLSQRIKRPLDPAGPRSAKRVAHRSTSRGSAGERKGA